MNKKTKLTPLMQQYYDIRQKYQDILLFFQVGDFFELFFDDAKKASSFLGIALTKRGKINGDPIPLCGVPVHAIDHYVSKLVRGGFKVGICRQLSEPRPGQVVERGVTQVYTPGTLTDSNLLDEKSASYLFSFFPLQDQWGLLFGELLTTQLFATMLPPTSEKILDAELIRFFPDEILVPRDKLGKSFEQFFRKKKYYTTFVDVPKDDLVKEWFSKQFSSEIIKKLNSHVALRSALATFHAYLYKNQNAALNQFKSLQFYRPEDFLLLDSATQRNLELVKNNQDGSRRNTLFSVIDKAVTSMGSRMIKKWLLRPLVKKEAIVQRQEVVSVCMRDNIFCYQLQEILKSIGDIERVVGRIALYQAPLHDYLMLLRALGELPRLKHILQKYNQIALLHIINRYLVDFKSLHALLESALNDDSVKDWKIKKGFDQQLDHLRELVENANKKILELERQEQQKTSINSLKIRYNKIHGYYIEITKPNLSYVPDYYIHQQTLVNRSRFVTPALQQLQHEIINARSHIEETEKKVFDRVKNDVVYHLVELRKFAHALAHLDALLGLSSLAYDNGYIQPSISNTRNISIIDGRHPVVEQSRSHGFIPNSTQLNDIESVWIITGPNMGGKSTYLRQVALIAILAHIGSFVPAKKADIALLDRIFTRIGAGDNLAEGKSTFLVEMEETATICTQATKNSLVILDEVGRGTSTFDGLAIAQAVVEHIYKVIQARCLFATHYHELTQLQKQFPGIASYYAASKKTNNGIVFLYKIMKGIADGSFGVEVAKLAQLPKSVIIRSEEILKKFKTGQSQSIQVHGAQKLPQESSILNLKINRKNTVVQFDADKASKLCEQIKRLKEKLKEEKRRGQLLADLDYENLSPKQAFDLLWKLREMN